MMNKLLKYECRAVGRLLVPAWAGAVILSALCLLLTTLRNMIPGAGSLPVLNIADVAINLLAGLLLLAMMLGCVVINIQRFYRLLGDQGYLMFSLPVTVSQHIAAKLLCACGSTIASFLVASGCAWLVGLKPDARNEVSAQAILVVPDARNEVSAQAILVVPDARGTALLAYVYLCLVLGMCIGYLYLYLCMTIGSRWPQQRLAASVITYFVLSFLVQIALSVLVILAAVAISSVPESTVDALTSWLVQADVAFPAGVPGTVWLLGAGCVLFLLAVNAILWGVIHHLLARHLNLP